MIMTMTVTSRQYVASFHSFMHSLTLVPSELWINSIHSHPHIRLKPVTPLSQLPHQVKQRISRFAANPPVENLGLVVHCTTAVLSL